MKAQMKAVMVSAVVIVLALAAVSGVTYSWFSDSDDANVTINTAKIDVGIEFPNQETTYELKTWFGEDRIIPYTINNKSTTEIVYRVSVTTSVEAPIADTPYNRVLIGGISALDDDGSGKTIDFAWTEADAASDDEGDTISSGFKLTFETSDQDGAINHINGSALTFKVSIVAYPADYKQTIETDQNGTTTIKTEDIATQGVTVEGTTQFGTGNDAKEIGVSISFNKDAADSIVGSDGNVTIATVMNDTDYTVQGGTDIIAAIDVSATMGSGEAKVTLTIPGIHTGVLVYHENDTTPINPEVKYLGGNTIVTFVADSFSKYFIESGAEYSTVDGDIVWHVSTSDELIEHLEKNDNVLMMNDIKIDPANMSNAYGKTGINVENGQAIIGNGHTLDIKGAGGTWDSGINTTGGLIKDLTVTGSFRGIFINHNSTHSETVVLENVIIDGTTYTISCDQGLNQNLVATNSTFKGWTSYAATLGSAKFTECYFGEGNGYSFCRPFAPTEFISCEFEAGFEIDPRAVVTFDNCTFDGVALTSENLSDLVTNADNATVV